MELQTINKRHITFNVGEREITLRLFKIQNYLYGVTYAIRSPEDKGKFSPDKEKEIVKQILDGRQKKQVFVSLYRHDLKRPLIESTVSGIVSNIMDYKAADVFLNNLKEDFQRDLQKYVPFKV